MNTVGNNPNKEDNTVVAESRGLGSLEDGLFKRGWNSGFGKSGVRKFTEEDNPFWDDDYDSDL